MYKFLNLFLAGCLLSLSSVSGCILSAQEAGDGPILRAAYAEFYPYSFTAEDGTAKGYNIDVTRQIASDAGYDVRFVPADNPKQFLEMLSGGEVDLTPLMALTPARRAAGLESTPLGEYALAVFVRHDSEISNIDMLTGKRVGVVTGSISDVAAAHIPSAVVVTYSEPNALLLPLLSGEVDAVVGVVEMFRSLARRSQVEEKVIRLEPSLLTMPYGLIVRRDLPDVHGALEQSIRRAAMPQSLTELRMDWFGRDKSITEHPWFFGVVQIVSGISLATLALGYYAYRLRRRSVQLIAENGENQLLIDAFDKMRGAIAIFDTDTQSVRWNSGFEARFPELVPMLRQGASVELLNSYAQKHAVFQPVQSGATPHNPTPRDGKTRRDGKTVKELVHTPSGASFELSIFRLGTRHQAAIWVDVTDLHRQKERITKQSNELIRKNKQLMAFSSMAAHDLKAPLVQQAALMDFILEDVAEAKIILPKEAQSHLTTLSDLSHRMGALVRDLLDYAKSDTIRENTECFEPQSRMDAILVLSGASSGIQVNVSPDIPAVNVAPDAFDLVMRNLISNAIKHHDKSTGVITLRGYSAGENVVIEVEDDGPGIDVEQHQRVFEPFCRLTNVAGTGLGLAFVKKTVQAWGGEIALRQARQRGSVFQITLPAAPAAVIALDSIRHTHPLVTAQQRASGNSY